MQNSRPGRPAPLLLLLLTLLSLELAPAFAAPHKELAKRLDALLAEPEIARGFWGIQVENLDTGEVLYSHDADHLFTPASNAKLFTTAAGLALIGPDYRFHTTVEALSSPDKYGRIPGDLVLVGRGDPNLSGRQLPYSQKTERPYPPARAIEELADQLIARGVKVIDGDIVGDDSFYSSERYAEGWAEGDLLWEYGAPVTALAINDNELFLDLHPGEHAGERAFLNVFPYADYYHFDNRVITTAAASGPRKLAIAREPGSHHVVISGTMPADDPGRGEGLAIEDPAEFAAILLRNALTRRGVLVFGHVRTRHADPANPPVTTASLVLAEHTSLPLSLDVQVINKVSQNLHAEMLLRLLGRERGNGGTLASGLEVLRGFLAQAGLDSSEFAFYDGSGLSRQDLVSPRATVKLLRYAASQPWGAAYQQSLPVAGADGTLGSRFKDLPASATLRAKTGTLDHVNALSGYLTTSRGDRLVISILSNNHTLSGRRASETLDLMLREIERARE